MSRKTCHFSVRFPPREIRRKKDYVYHINISKSVRSYLLFIRKIVNRIPCIVTGVRVEWKMCPRVWTCSNSKPLQFQIHDQYLSGMGWDLCERTRIRANRTHVRRVRSASSWAQISPIPKDSVWIHCTAQSGCLDSYIRWRTCKTHDKPREAVKKRYTRGSPNGGTQYCKPVLPAEQEDTQRIEIS